MANYTAQDKFHKENMLQVKASYKKDFVEDFRKALRATNKQQSTLIRKVMEDTIMEANFKLFSLNKSEKSLLMSLCDFYQITYKQEVIDEASKNNINILNLSTAQDHLSACLFVSEVIYREIDEFVLDSKYVVCLADILNKEWAKAETINKIAIMDIMIKLGMRNEA